MKNPRSFTGKSGLGRRLAAVILTAALTISLFPASTFAATHTHSYGDPEWIWTDTDDDCTAKARFTCTGCDETETVDASVERTAYTAPTCKEGSATYTGTVTFDDNSYKDKHKVTLAAVKDHTEGEVKDQLNVIDATCTEDGSYDTVTYCSECGDEMSRTTTVIPATGHDWQVSGWDWSDDLTAATLELVCANDSSHTQEVEADITLAYDEDADCEDSEKTLTATAVYNDTTYTDEKTITGHYYQLPSFDWTGDDSCYANAACYVCGETSTVKCTVTTETTEPTCEEDGKTSRVASASFKKGADNLAGCTYTDEKSETLPAIGHDYQLTAFEWADDYSSAQAVFTCQNDTSHVEKVDAVVTSVTEGTTCTDEGTITYTATAEFEDQTYTDTKETPGTPLGHIWAVDTTQGEDGWSWSSDFKDAIVYLYCERDQSHTAEVDAYVSFTTDAPSCEESGTVTVTAEAEKDGQTFTDVLTFEDVTLGHMYTDNVCTMCGAYEKLSTPELTDINYVNKGVKIKWNAVDDAQNYRIYRKVKGGSWTSIGTSTTTSYTDTKAKTSETTVYYYTVRCITKDGETKLSSYDKTGLSITYYATPSVKSVSGTTTGVSVKWNAVEDAPKYMVMRRSDTGSNWDTVGYSTGTSFTDTSAKAGTYYIYTIRVCSKDGSLRLSGYPVNGKSLTYRATPVLTKVKNTSTGVKFTWEAVDGAENYRVYRKTSNGSWAAIGVTESTSYTDTTASSGTSYHYSVRCVNSTGKVFESGYDKEGLTITYLSVPKLSSAVKTDSGNKVTWSKVSGATGYYVYRKTENGSWKKVAKTKKTTWTDSEVNKSTVYYYTVKAYSGSSTSTYKSAGIKAK